jgi:hypothetical protein
LPACARSCAAWSPALAPGASVPARISGQAQGRGTGRRWHRPATDFPCAEFWCEVGHRPCLCIKTPCPILPAAFRRKNAGRVGKHKPWSASPRNFWRLWSPALAPGASVLARTSGQAQGRGTEGGGTGQPQIFRVRNFGGEVGHRPCLCIKTPCPIPPAAFRRKIAGRVGKHKPWPASPRNFWRLWSPALAPGASVLARTSGQAQGRGTGRRWHRPAIDFPCAEFWCEVGHRPCLCIKTPCPILPAAFRRKIAGRVGKHKPPSVPLNPA